MKENTERPILFSTPMVKSILDGKKPMTRRVVNKLNGFSRISQFSKSDTPGYDFCFRDKEMRLHDMTKDRVLDLCPYGKPGSRLWVRETWQAWSEFDKTSPSELPENVRLHINYPATSGVEWDSKKRPSIHMPRWASRIDLEVTSIKIERLNDISEDDAKKEGADALICDNLDQQSFLFCKGLGMPITDKGTPYRNGFALLWDNINAKKGKGWDTNPWVWAIEFKRI